MGAILGVSWEVIGIQKDIVTHVVFFCVFLVWEAGNRQSRVAKLNLSVFYVLCKHVLFCDLAKLRNPLGKQFDFYDFVSPNWRPSGFNVKILCDFV